MLVTLCVCFTCLFVPTEAKSVQVIVTSTSSVPKNITLFTYDSHVETCAHNRKNIRSGQFPSEAKNVKAVVEDPEIAEVKISKGPGGYCFQVHALKKGTTTIKYTGILKGKKVIETSAIHVYAYKNPVKSLKIGSTEYAEKFNKTDRPFAVGKFVNKKAKIVCKPSKGWSVKDISFQYEIDHGTGAASSGFDPDVDSRIADCIKPIEGGTGAEIYVHLYNKKYKNISHCPLY